MKYLAILKDSLREAIDTKVFFVMMGLSCVVIAIVACLGYEPVPADRGLQDIVGRFGRDPRNPFGLPVSFTVEKFQQLNDSHRPWEGEFRFSITAKDQQ